jgi:hypothetical protein
MTNDELDALQDRLAYRVPTTYDAQDAHAAIKALREENERLRKLLLGNKRTPALKEPT